MARIPAVFFSNAACWTWQQVFDCYLHPNLFVSSNITISSNSSLLWSCTHIFPMFSLGHLVCGVDNFKPIYCALHWQNEIIVHLDVFSSFQTANAHVLSSRSNQSYIACHKIAAFLFSVTSNDTSYSVHLFTKKSVLISINETWNKKSPCLFDVTMGSFESIPIEKNRK